MVTGQPVQWIWKNQSLYDKAIDDVEESDL